MRSSDPPADDPGAPDAFLDPLFLGPKGENAQLLESQLLDLLRDHVYWRRNFHPEDRPPIPADAPYRQDFQQTLARTRQELFWLSAELKRAVPFFSPRYVGHMCSDLLLPGLLAQLATTLWNPNNVAEAAAPATLDKELEVGRQLAAMLGYSVDPSRRPCAWGHLTSGGTLANYEGLWNLRAAAFYPLALAAAARRLELDLGAVGPARRPLDRYRPWQLVNLSLDQVLALRGDCLERVRARGDRRLFQRFTRAIIEERLETLGMASFFARHPEIEPPRVVVPVSAHYSWQKAMKVLGLGAGQLLRIDVDEHMRMDPAHLAAVLDDVLGREIPVLAVIGVLGTTEFGTVDPIHEIVALRRRWRRRGAGFGIHVDAAWGGFLAAAFRRPDGSLLPRATLRRRFRYFPSSEVYRAFAAVGDTDSATVDPHKLGYLPYPSGAFVARNREVVDLLSQEAAYVFDLERDGISREEQLRDLGRYVLEGSKPGAAAAAASVTFRVLPLHHRGFGRLMAQAVKNGEAFFDRLNRLREELADVATLVMPFETDTCILCFAVNPRGNRHLAVMNRFGRRLYDALRVDPEQPVQTRELFGSCTALARGAVAGRQADRILDQLGIDRRTFRAEVEEASRDADHIFILRHTLMNPFLLADRGDGSYLERFAHFLATTIRRLADQG
ncbi:MAG: pyridoxal-dependent decarboxylase [Acidobacteria bacterium]|nr:MAG: pyridoxal-dependent decarboxylase [Acidobacteriota bacterium]